MITTMYNSRIRLNMFWISSYVHTLRNCTYNLKIKKNNWLKRFKIHNWKIHTQLTSDIGLQFPACSASICSGIVVWHITQGTRGILENSAASKGSGSMSMSSWSGTKNSTILPLFDADRSCWPLYPSVSIGMRDSFLWPPPPET